MKFLDIILDIIVFHRSKLNVAYVSFVLDMHTIPLEKKKVPNL